jgi:hypothetical protein
MGSHISAARFLQFGNDFEPLPVTEVVQYRGQTNLDRLPAGQVVRAILVGEQRTGHGNGHGELQAARSWQLVLLQVL